MLVEQLQRIRHRHIRGEYKLPVKLLIILVVEPVALIASKDSLEGLKRFHQNGAFLHDVQEAVRIEIQGVEGGEVCFAGAGGCADQSLGGTHGPDPVQLLQRPPLHIIGLDTGIRNIIVHIPPLDGVVQPRLIFFNQIACERQGLLPQAAEFTLRGVIDILLAFSGPSVNLITANTISTNLISANLISAKNLIVIRNHRHIPLNILEQRIHSDVRRSDQNLVVIFEVEQVALRVETDLVPLHVLEALSVQMAGKPIRIPRLQIIEPCQ